MAKGTKKEDMVVEPWFEYHFPGHDNIPAVVVQARNMDEALTLYQGQFKQSTATAKVPAETDVQ